jgi:hypothetical protein
VERLYGLKLDFAIRRIFPCLRQRHHIVNPLLKPAGVPQSK